MIVYISGGRKMKEERVAMICKALGDANRLKITSLLTKGERCACELLEEFNITQPTLSHHMKVLGEAELITSRKDGKNTYYQINCDTFSSFRDYFNETVCCNRTKCCSDKD